MIEPLKFLAEIAPTDCALQFGDDGARIEIWSKPILAEFTQATQLVGWTRKVLRLRFFMPTDDTAWVEFIASVAPLNSAIRLTKDNRVKVKFDVPETEKANAARLAGMADRVFRLEVAMQGEKQPAKTKGAHGAFWNALVKSTAFDCADLHEALKVSGRDMVLPALRLQFEVESLSFVSPETAIAAFEQANLPGVAAIARRLANG